MLHVTIVLYQGGKRLTAYKSAMCVCCKMKSRDFAHGRIFARNLIYSDSTFELSVLFHACHVYRGLEPLKTVPAYHLFAFANSKDSDEPVLMCSQSLFCYNPQSMEAHVDQGSNQTLHV